ncbi:ABC transporter permease [Estrella lausannensis]|uniref:ABC transmembrane type-2 domain-containing protein n=1 Tax=Estrella lausannensis TaxID=483423 RepID=A0A0H5E5X4_9BACT|nr:ABC transporter permease [Estrella lausannensis]CRX38630.1 hypothetical protein ELAC_1291 [Estrella lausannensis]
MLAGYRVKALIKKELIQIVRDPSTLLISVVLPLILLFLYGFGVSLDLKHLRIGVVLEDTGPDAQSFLRALMDSPYFDVTTSRDRYELTHALTVGKLRGMVVIPSYFSDFKNRKGQSAPIQVIADGSEPNTAAMLQNYVDGAFQNWIRQKPLIRPVPRFWYNEQLESRNFLLPGSLALIMTLIGTLLTALVVTREWERGTMEAMIATPITKDELIIGKILPYFALGFISMAISASASIFLFNVPFRGSLLALFLVTAAFLYCALSLGLMISTIARSQLIAYQIAMVTSVLPAYILSGFLFEISSMPTWIQFLTYIIPAKYFVQSLQTLFLVGDVWKLILINTVPMLILGTLFLFISKRKTAKRLDA